MSRLMGMMKEVSDIQAKASNGHLDQADIERLDALLAELSRISRSKARLKAKASHWTHLMTKRELSKLNIRE